LRIKRLVSANFSEHAINSPLVFHQKLVCLVFIHSVLAYHKIHFLLDFDHESISTLSFSKFNAELRERHFLSCPVDIEIHDLGGGPATRNRPNSCRNEFLDDVAAPKYSAGKVKSTLAASNPYCSMIEFGSVHGSQGRDRAGQGVSWPLIARNFRHVDLQVKPVRIPVVGEIGLAAGSDLNPRNPFSGILVPSVEGTTCMLSFVELPIVDLDNIGNDDQFEESGEGVNTKVTAKGLHDPKKL
jgi:hypothetical protein